MHVFCFNCMHVCWLSKCVLFCMCTYVCESSWMSLSLQACHLVWGIWALYHAENSTIDYDYLWYVLCVLQLIRTYARTHARTPAHTHTHTHTHTHNLNLNAWIWDTNNEVYVHQYMLSVLNVQYNAKYMYYWLCRYSRTRMTEYWKQLQCLENS